MDATWASCRSPVGPAGSYRRPGLRRSPVHLCSWCSSCVPLGTGPPPAPEERHPVYPQRFNWFQSTPRNAPRLPIQTNNQQLEPHISNENEFPLKEKTEVWANPGSNWRPSDLQSDALPTELLALGYLMRFFKGIWSWLSFTSWRFNISTNQYC